jgi:hypothetical protein
MPGEKVQHLMETGAIEVATPYGMLGKISKHATKCLRRRDLPPELAIL